MLFRCASLKLLPEVLTGDQIIDSATMTVNSLLMATIAQNKESLDAYHQTIADTLNPAALNTTV